MTPDDREFFERNGYLTGLRVHDADANRRIRRLFDELEKTEGRDRCQVGLQGRHTDVPFVWEMATVPAILDAIEALMGPDILVLSTHIFCKYSSTEEDQEDQPRKFVAWHQDVTYWGLEPPFALTAWYAVDDSDVENGCMRVIPGSHRRGILQHATSERPGNLLSINQEVDDEVDDEQAVDLVLRAGEMSIHHGHLVHGSNPNLSDRRRCGLTIRYVPPHVRQVAENSLRQPWKAILARGEDEYRHFGDWKLEFGP